MSAAFIVGSILAAAVFVAALLRPLLQAAPATGSDASGSDVYGAAVSSAGARLQRRLWQIDADQTAGFLSEADAAEAAIEAKRAALRENAEEIVRPPAETRRLRSAAVIAVAAAPLVAAAIYARVGSPNYAVEAAAAAADAARDPAAEIAALPPEERAAMIDGMVASLEARLEDAPDDLAGWRMLARSQVALGRFEASYQSFRRVVDLSGGALDDWRNFAGAYIAAAPTGFPDAAAFKDVLDAIEAIAPGDPFALYYRGGYHRMRGQRDAAISAWRRMLDTMPADLPADAPARLALERLIAETEAEAQTPPTGEDAGN